MEIGSCYLHPTPWHTTTPFKSLTALHSPGEAATHLEASCDVSEAEELLHGLGRARAPDCINLCLGCALHVLVACQVVHRVAENGRIVVDPVQEGQHLRASSWHLKWLGAHHNHLVELCNDSMLSCGRVSARLKPALQYFWVSLS